MPLASREWKRTARAFVPICLAMLLLLATAGCGGLVRQATAPLIDGLTMAIQKQNDPQTVRDGAPAYLLLADGLAEKSPDDPETLATAARLYSAYVSAFVLDEDPARAMRLSLRARDYAFRAVAIVKPKFGELNDKPYAEFEPVAAEFQAGDEAWLYLVISTWVGVIQADKGNWDRLAEIAKVKLLTERLLALDEGYYYGAGHLLLGVLAGILPPALGGKPDEAKAHFERAIELSEGKFLLAFVYYAQSYAKAVYDRALYEKLLRRALDTPADIAPELTLVNTLARQQAEKLLAEAETIFDQEGSLP
jgi:hypothetical protein